MGLLVQLRNPFILLRKIRTAWTTTRPRRSPSILIRARRQLPWVILSCDLQPRELLVDYLRESPFPLDNSQTPIILSTHPVRRLQSNLWLAYICLLSRIFKSDLVVITSDGFASGKFLIRPYNLHAIVHWYNSPDESDLFWAKHHELLKRTQRTEIFPNRPGTVDRPCSLTLCRQSSDLVLARPSRLSDHFPTLPQIVFASDITLELRKDARDLRRRLQKLFGNSFDIDELLWAEASSRVNQQECPGRFELKDLLLNYFDDYHLVSVPPITEIELDALRLTIHGRERYLFLLGIAQSDLAEHLRIIGQTWRQIPILQKFVIDQDRFPSGVVVHDLQRSRVCPDFGSSLGSIPLYMRAQILAGRATGLMQRRDPNGNPLLKDAPPHRLFSNLQELLTYGRIMMNLDDDEFKREEEIIRGNYLDQMLQSRVTLSDFVRERLRLVEA